MSTNQANAKTLLLDMTRYQWLVLFAAWLGWGFDSFDALLFNYVAPTCVPTLTGTPLGSPEAKRIALEATGWLTSLLLIGWGVGGILFGRVADRIGRTRTLLLTMLLYSIGTAACAFAPNLTALAIFRVIASLGIGGEWAAGAAMVAEVVPEKRRVEAGALLYTAAPLGLFLATFVTFQIQNVFFKSDPAVAWRYVFLFGLIPAAVAIVVRWFVKEPERWKGAASLAKQASLKELFAPDMIRTTASGLMMAMIALITWWSCNAFLPLVAKGLGGQFAQANGLDAQQIGGEWVRFATNIFNFGALIGTLLTIPLAKSIGRKPMFAIYFAVSMISILATFGLPLEPRARLDGFFFIGISIFGVLGAFTYYLPELFPTHLRASGAGFCYNIGRFVAAIGPFLIGSVAAQGKDAISSAIHVLFYVGFVPLLALLALPFVQETKSRPLAD